jgi:hypothetical protein
MTDGQVAEVLIKVYEDGQAKGYRFTKINVLLNEKFKELGISRIQFEHVVKEI